MPADEFKSEPLWHAWINRGASVLKRDRNPGPKPDGGCRIRHSEPGLLAGPTGLRASATGKLQICATADQNDVAPARVPSPTVHWPTEHACLNSGAVQMCCERKTIRTRAYNGDFHRRVH